MKKEPDTCPHCSAKCVVTDFAEGKVYSYACTSEVVVTEKGRRIVKNCPSTEGRGFFA